MLMYWIRLFQQKLKAWQLIGLGLLWVAGGIVIYAKLHSRDAGGMDLAVTLMMVGSGGLHFWMALRGIRRARAEDALIEDVAHREAVLEARRSPATGAREPTAPPPPPRRPSPPRLGDDPFREPPRATVQAIRHDRPAVVAPVVQNASESDGPSFLK